MSGVRPVLSGEADALIPGAPFVGQQVHVPEAVGHRHDRPRQIGLRNGSDDGIGIGAERGVEHVLRDRHRRVHVEEAVLDAAIDVGVDGYARPHAE